MKETSWGEYVTARQKAQKKYDLNKIDRDEHKRLERIAWKKYAAEDKCAIGHSKRRGRRRFRKKAVDYKPMCALTLFLLSPP
jgi:hypothetical protein